MSLSFYSGMYSLAGRAAIVFGVSHGLGSALAETVARAGADVVIAGRSEARGHACVERIRSVAGYAGFRQANLEDTASIAELMDYTLGELGRVDCVLMTATRAWQPAWFDTVWQTVKPRMGQQTSGGVVLSVASASLIETSAETAASGNARFHHLWVRDDADDNLLPAIAGASLMLLAAGTAIHNTQLMFAGGKGEKH